MIADIGGPNPIVAVKKIGTLNEGSLHAALKTWYAEEGDRFEVPVEGFVADIVRGDLIIEIQTGSASALRHKLKALLRRHPVRLALPVAGCKTIVQADGNGAITTRQSRKHGEWVDAVSRMVALREVLGDPNLSVDVVLIREEEVRVPRSDRRRRRRAWTVYDRRLVEVFDSVTFDDPIDYLAFIPSELLEPFTTRMLAATLGKPRRLAQQVAYTLRHIGTIAPVGKRGNEILYRRAFTDVSGDPDRPEAEERVP